MGEGQVDVFLCARCDCDVLPLVVELVVTVLSSCDHFGHGALLKTKIHNVNVV